MKKNTMMRVASVLLVAVLLSTCVISGTFAKYVTEVDGSDSARVAKWGIGSDLSGTDTFSTTYHTDKIVSGANPQDDVVAPGSNDEGVYKLTGKPETAYQVTFECTKQDDVFLKKGTYTCADGADAYAVDNDYNPIQWIVTLTTSGAVSGTGALTTGANNFDDLETAAAAITATKIDFAANAECDVVITIAWSWAFEDEQLTDNAADTVLGNLAANAANVKGSNDTTLVEDTDYCLDVGYELVLTASQVTAQNP